MTRFMPLRCIRKLCSQLLSKSGFGEYHHRSPRGYHICPGAPKLRLSSAALFNHLFTKRKTTSSNENHRGKFPREGINKKNCSCERVERRWIMTKEKMEIVIFLTSYFSLQCVGGEVGRLEWGGVFKVDSTEYLKTHQRAKIVERFILLVGAVFF